MESDGSPAFSVSRPSQLSAEASLSLVVVPVPWRLWKKICLMEIGLGYFPRASSLPPLFVQFSFYLVLIYFVVSQHVGPHSIGRSIDICGFGEGGGFHEGRVFVAARQAIDANLHVHMKITAVN